MEQDQTRSHISKIDLEIDWRGLVAGLGIFLFFSVFGPALLFLALALRRWGSSSIWRAPDRWANIRALALALPLLYLPTLLFWHTLASWWIRLPGWLGDWSIMPPAFSSIPAHALLTLPLAPALALLLERGQPHTLPIQHVIRQLRPNEIQVPPSVAGLIAAPEEAKGNVKTSAKRKSAAATQATLLEAGPAPKPTRQSQRKARDPRPLGESLLDERQRRRAPQVLPPHRDGPPPIDWTQVKE